MTNDAASGPARSEGVWSHFVPEEKEEEGRGEGYLAPAAQPSKVKAAEAKKGEEPTAMR